MRIPFRSADAIFRAADEYPYGDTEREEWLIANIPRALGRGHLLKSELIEVARWKWRGGRTRQLCDRNTEQEVKEVSAFAFSARTEKARYRALLALDGVGEPMASVILHFAYRDHYPILDVRAMNAVGGSTSWTFEHWLEYTTICQKAARRFGVSMRVLDRALWVLGKPTSSSHGNRWQERSKS